MFKCEKCGKFSQKKEKPIRVITKKRNKIYKYLQIGDKNFEITNKAEDQVSMLNDRSTRLKKKFFETNGWEIEKEIGVCNECFDTHYNRDMD